jgi:glycosyltransferase involved in cell wall biosynthesis
VTAIPPRVSVCLPVYNGATYLSASIASVLAQTWTEFRLVIVDNCSTDGTPDVVRSFSDPRIVYHRNRKNLGLVGNFNRCLDLAEGELVCIWHDDDVMLPDNLARKVAFLDAHRSVAFVHSNLWLIDAIGHRYQEHWHEDSRRDYVARGGEWLERFALGLANGPLVFIGAALVRRAAYDRAGRVWGAQPSCCDDEMWMRLALCGDVGCLGEPLVENRYYSGSVSSAYTGQHWLRAHLDNVRAVVERHRAEIPEATGLVARVRAAFAADALVSAHDSSYQGRFRESWGFLLLAVRLSAGVLASRRFWWLAFRNAVGTPGVRLYGRLRGRVASRAR